MAENTSTAESQASENEEFGVMEKGGRLQFVRATGNDIRSRSPTPTSSENETETTAAKLEGEPEQESFQLDETYSQGSDQFEKDSDIDKKCSEEDARKGSTVIENYVGRPEDTSIQEAVRQVSGQSVASQTDIDKLDQLVIGDGEEELGSKELEYDSMQEEIRKKEVPREVAQEGINTNKNAPEQTKADTPIECHSVVEKSQQGIEKRPKTSKMKKSPDESPFPSEICDSEDRQKINDLAFMTWLKNKNREQQKKRKEAFVIPSEEKEEKRKMCEVAYRSWLMKKAKEEKEKLRTEKLQNDELLPDRKCSAEITFDIWLQNKLKQKRRESRRIVQEHHEQEQAARTVDREVSKEAYKRWKNKKREEKRDEISRRLLYRKLYFSQEQELRLSQSRRYAVQ